MGMKEITLRHLLSRDEAELLTDLLMLTDHHCAYDLEHRIRAYFGMCSRELELEARKITLGELRRKTAKQMLHDEAVE